VTAPVRFVVLEEIDSAGQTTAAPRLAAALRARGIPATFLSQREGCADLLDPGERLLKLRDVLWEYPEEEPIRRWGDQHWFHLMASWFSLVDQAGVRSLLARGRSVIADGWFYQYAARFSLKPSFPPELIESCFGHLAVPDRVFLLDPEPRLDGPPHDVVEYQEVRAGLLERAQRGRWTVLQGALGGTALLERLLEELDPHGPPLMSEV
jgi:thymidylate kinase